MLRSKYGKVPTSKIRKYGAPSPLFLPLYSLILWRPITALSWNPWVTSSPLQDILKQTLAGNGCLQSVVCFTPANHFTHQVPYWLMVERVGLPKRKRQKGNKTKLVVSLTFSFESERQQHKVLENKHFAGIRELMFWQTWKQSNWITYRVCSRQLDLCTYIVIADLFQYGSIYMLKRFQWRIIQIKFPKWHLYCVVVLNSTMYLWIVYMKLIEKEQLL